MLLFAPLTTHVKTLPHVLLGALYRKGRECHMRVGSKESVFIQRISVVCSFVLLILVVTVRSDIGAATAFSGDTANTAGHYLAILTVVWKTSFL
jgi:hypothetical protein